MILGPSTVHGNLGVLSGLTRLVVSHLYEEDLLFGPAISYNLEWCKLVALQQVLISGPSIFNTAVVNFVDLPKLTGCELELFKPGNVDTASHVARLADCLSAKRPDVEVAIDYAHWLPVGLLEDG